MRSRGFTLIELLVVVAIIALLIAILLPSLGRAKSNAVRVQCASVLKQWGTVITMYAQENNDYFGLEWKDAANNKYDWNTLSVGATPTLYDPEWNSFASQGRKISQEFRTCPGDPMFGRQAAAGGQGGTIVSNSNVADRPPMDYTMVRYIPVISLGSLMYKTGQSNHPQTTLLMCDSPPNVRGLTNLPYISSMAELDGASSAPNEAFIDSLQKRHMGIGNAMFMDVHVEQHKYQDFVKNIPSTTIPGPPIGGQTALYAPTADASKVWTTLTTP
ncbi:MAG TPA: prepilin-type N-terminal cleavage/methylation domain-containing protein [Phycisphaerae bacterium]|nr:prepilin-type N-terminal cleavage/methylation domain-containing protein [Phycisphaerae bacterium]